MNADEMAPVPGVTRRQLLKGGFAGVSALALGQLLAACSGSSSGPSTATGNAPTGSVSALPGGGKTVPTMTWALFADPVSMDYAFAYDFNTNPVVLCMVESLLRMAPNGELLPNLAQSWKATDPTTYVYTLRQGVKFHDGTTMRAEDAAASMQRIIDPAVGSYLASFVSNVKSVTATGPYELTVKLTAPDALWKYVPATTVGAVVPKAFLDKNGKNVGKANVGIVGTGPYKFGSWQQGQQVTVTKNPQYWNTNRVPKVNQINFKVLSDENTVIEGMVAGQIDGAFNLSGKSLKALNGTSTIRVVSGPSYFVHFVGLNVSKPPFNDVRVRQALSYAIDKQGVLDSTWGGAGTLCKSPVTPSMWSFEQSQFKSAYDALPDFGLDLSKAKSLIKSAGAEGKSATLLVATPHENDEGVIVQAAAKSIGLDIKLQNIPYDQLLSKIASKTHDYDGFLLEWSSDYPDPGGTLFQCFTEGRLTNYTDYNVSKVNSALTSSATETNATKRAQELIAAQKQIVEDQTWIILFSPTTNMPLSTKLGGYDIRPLWYWDSGWAADISGT
ncbi:MAG TPA: ABC transporter substrate-binding protein [Mycobacteriales bacterium]|nr:ABC transporter substrate-binding protein [Mycobacteriales bacterium]